MAVASLASAGISAYGSYKQGQYEQAAANATATQYEAQATQERAVSQLQAARQRAAAKSQSSDQRSLMAASGFASDDPTSRNLVSETVKAQTLQELLTLAEGEDEARQQEYSARLARAGGKNAMASARVNAAGSLLGSSISWYDRYGPGRSAGGAGGAGGVAKKPMPSTRSGVKLRAG